MADELVRAYGLGTGGVNVVKAPLHLEENELTKAQNALPDNQAGLGSIRKRDGLVALNGTPLAGSATGIVGLPLPDFGGLTRTLYAALGSLNSNTWKTSLDGTTWADATSPQRAQLWSKIDGAATFFYYNNRIVSLDRRILFPINNYVQYPTANSDGPPYNSWDGTTDATIAQVPFNPGSGATPGDTDSYFIIDSCLHQGQLYISCFDPLGGLPDRNGRVFRVDHLTGQLTQIGTAFGDGGFGETVGGMPWALCSYQGLLYVGVYGITGAGVGRVYRINPNITDPRISNLWTEDNPTASPLNGYITSMREFKGDLYVACMEDDGATPAVIYKRSAAGAYTVTVTGDAAAVDGGNHWILLGEFNSLLFAANINVAGTPDVNVIYRFDGTTWTSDLDVFSTYALNLDCGQMVTFGGAMYVVFYPRADAGTTGFILKRTTGSVWSRPLSGANLRGFLAVLEQEA